MSILSKGDWLALGQQQVTIRQWYIGDPSPHQKIVDCDEWHT